MHPDALKQIDDRREPIETTPIQTEHSHFEPDTIGDPEGSARRAAADSDPFPPWVYTDLSLSAKDFWGKPWADKKQHLVPKAAFIAEVEEYHAQGMETLGNMFAFATAKGNIANLKLIQSSFSAMLANTDTAYHFPLMQALQNAAYTALAERAFSKSQYASALTRNMRDNDTEGAPPKDLPDYVNALQDRMTTAAAQAGTWCHVHMEMWRQLEWNGAPKYDNITNAIKLRCVNHARWIDQKFRKDSAPRPKLADHLITMVNC